MADSESPAMTSAVVTLLVLLFAGIGIAIGASLLKKQSAPEELDSLIAASNVKRYDMGEEEEGA
jgi:hypothetical protein